MAVSTPTSGYSRALRRFVLTCAGAAGALVIGATSALAETESIRFDFDPDDPTAEHSWTVPDRVEQVQVEAAGGGGGGGENVTTSGGVGALVEAVLATQGGESLTIRVGGGGSVLTGTGIGGGGGGGASIVTSSSVGLTDLLVIAGGGGGAGQGTDSSVSSNGGSAGANTNGAGGDAGALQYANRGKGGALGAGGSGFSRGTDFAVGSDAKTGAGGAVPSKEVAAQVGGAGGGPATFGGGGGGGAGYGGGGRGGSASAGGKLYGAGGGAGGSIASGATVDPDTVSYSSAGGSGGVGNAAAAAGWVTITWVVPAPLPDPETPSADAGLREPVEFEFAMPAGMACEAPRSDSSGLWVQLPAAEQCSLAVDARSGSSPELLGWATQPDFPVDIAQRQVDNGWGAYELFDNSGDLTEVFVPAGGWTRASADTSLFPIWAADN